MKKNKLHSRGMRMMALGMAAVSATGLRAAAQTQIASVEAPNMPAPAQSTVRRFDIPAGDLSDALTTYTRVAGVAVDLKLADPTVAGFHTAGLHGLYSNSEALRALLQGTGLSFQFTGEEHAEISIRNSESVSVTATALPDAVTMDKFTEPLLDTPQSVTVVPQFVLHDQGVSTLRDSLRNVPGISLAAGEGGAQGDNLTIRGFTARNDLFLDGIRDFGSYYRDSFNYEQVDVLEGPAGIQFGRGSTGGVINQESKVPQTTQFMNGGIQLGSDATRRVTLDINQPLNDMAKGSAFRVNMMGVEGGVAGRPFAANRRFGIAPTIEFGMNSPTRVSLSYIHLSANDTPDYGLPWLNDRLVQGADRHAYFGFPETNYIRTNDDIVTLKVDHDFGPGARLHSTTRWANYPRSAQITEPQICSNPAASVPVGGFVAALPTSAVNSALTCAFNGASAPSTIVVNRNQIQTKSVEAILWNQTEGVFRFDLAGLRNNLVVGAEGGQEVSNPIRTNYVVNKINTVPAASLLNPQPASTPFSGTGYTTSITHTKAESVGVYFVDTIKLGRLFELSGGIRWDRFDTGYNLYQPTPPAGGTVTAAVAPISRVDKQPSYRAAFVYKPKHNGSVYFDYGTSFNPAAESLSLSATLVNSADLKSEENETFEAGTKWNFFGEKLLMEGAFFNTQKNNAREASPTDSTLTVNSGNQLVRGFQTSIVGRLPEGMDIIAGYAYMHSEVVKSVAFPNAVGYQLANVPKQTFNAFLTHRMPKRFFLGLGGNYVAARTASSTTPYVPTSFGPKTAQGYQVLSTGMKQVPGYWLFNAMLRRPISDHLELQANVYNLADRFFIDQPHPSHLVPGSGRSVLVGFNFKF